MTKKRLMRLSSLCLVVCLCVAMFACGKQPEEPVVESTGTSDMTYTVEVMTENGVALEGIGTYIYADATLEELVWFAKTDASGKITFTDAASNSYVAVLKNVPAGYLVEESYPITGENTQIKLPMEKIEEDALSDVKLKLGDSIFDFTVTTPEGTEYTISELLADKEAVVLNFWYLECNPCRAEFPYLQAAYEEYSDKIEVLALNPVNQDQDAVAQFRKDQGLTFPMAVCDPVWQDVMQLTAYPTTVVIDRFGVISLIHTGSITEEGVFEDVFAYFTAEDYQQGVVQDVADLKTEDDEEENKDEEIDFVNPTEIGGVTSFQVMVKPGEVVYVDVYKVISMYMSLKDPDAYVLYKDKKYTPSGGVVGLTISSSDVTVPVHLGFGNTGTETKLYTINLSQFQGTYGNPYSMKLGEFTVKVAAGNDQGVYYTYTAAEEGVLTIKCTSATAGVPYDIVLYNLTTGGWFNLQGDAKFDADGNPMVSVKVNKGNKVQVIFGSLPDSSGAYPKITMKVDAYMGEPAAEETEKEEKILYAITVTDENRKPIPGVQVYFEVDGKQVTAASNDKGLAYTQQVAGTYKATIKVPNGYKAYTTQFELTEKIPTLAVKLDSVVVEQVSYTVKVVDEEGTPVEGALVSIDTSFGYTDASGVYTVTLLKGEYQAVISADGYVSTTCDLPENGNLDVTLQKSDGTEEPDEDSAEYTVKTVDYDGNPISGVVVTFTGEKGTAMQAVDAAGVAKVTLPKGEYTIALAFNSGTYYYDISEVLLTAEQPSATVTLVAGVKGETGNLYGEATYYVSEGATYVQTQADIVNYFLFEPDVGGVYEITTTDPAAKISYWGGSTAFISDQTTDKNCVNNVLTLNIKPSNLGGTQVLGVTGADSCVLVIKRVGDAILDENDLEPEIWEGKYTPTSAFKLGGVSGELTFVDMTGDVKAVHNANDGYYHLNTAEGPVLYMALGDGLNEYRWLSLSDCFGVTDAYAANNLNYVYYENGVAVRKESYTQCIIQYINCRDVENYGLYPLTEDLIFMLQQGGAYKGWYDAENPNCLIPEEDAGVNYNKDLLWMFNCCYFE